MEETDHSLLQALTELFHEFSEALIVELFKSSANVIS
jgi:hypothetical protein